MEYYITSPKDYWIATNAVNISLNALGNPNRIQCSVDSGTVIRCFIESIDGLGYTVAHGYHQWPVSVSNTYFNSDTAKYVYVAIPRSQAVGTQAIVVFPSEQLDIYGKNASNSQVGSTDYYYVWLQGIISAVYTDGGVRKRRMQTDIRTGELGTAEGDNNKYLSTEWYTYSSVSGFVTFLKEIRMSAQSWFRNLRLGENKHELTGVATATTGDDYVDSETLVVTPSYLNDKYLNKKREDQAEEEIGFVKGLWVKAKGLFGFDKDGNITAADGFFAGMVKALHAVIDTISSTNYQGGELTGTGWQITNDDGSGTSRMEVDNLVVRMKMLVNVLEARKYVALGGNYVYSPAASVIEQVDYYGEKVTETGERTTEDVWGGEQGGYYDGMAIEVDAGKRLDLTSEDTDISIVDGITGNTLGTLTYTATEHTIALVHSLRQNVEVSYTVTGANELLGYETVKVPFLVRLIPMLANTKLFSRSKVVKVRRSGFDYSAVKSFRCWIKADDGTTRTINTWQPGMLARCQTLDVNVSPDGTHSETYYEDKPYEVTAAQNKFYWREVIATGQAPFPVNDDGNVHSYVDLSNETDHFLAGSDRPTVGDSIVCFGGTKKDYANIIAIETVGDDAPAIKEFRGVGLHDITRDNTSNELPVFNTINRQFTKISPTTGNEFYAPHFYVETSNGTTSDVASFMVSADGILAKVEGQIANGKNMLGGVLTGEGWKSADSVGGTLHDITMDGEKMKRASGDSYIVSPEIALTNGTTYTLSFRSETGGNYSIAIEGNTNHFTPTISGSVYFTFTFTSRATENVRIYFGFSAIYYPQLELGSTATAFDAPTTDVSSRIKQTADEIDASVRDDLGEVGINISGLTKNIKLKADKVNFYDSSGTNLNPLVYIDPITGTLRTVHMHAVDGEFEGTVTASNFYISSLFVGDGQSDTFIGLLSKDTFRADRLYPQSGEDRTICDSFNEGDIININDDVYNVLYRIWGGEFGDNEYCPPGWKTCTGHYQKIFNIYGGSGGTSPIYLPSPSLYPGKMIEVYNNSTTDIEVHCISSAREVNDYDSGERTCFVSATNGDLQDYNGLKIRGGYPFADVTSLHTKNGFVVPIGKKKTFLSVNAYTQFKSSDVPIAGTDYFFWVMIETTIINV